MKESDIHADNAIITQLKKKVLLYTKRQYMKEANFLADSAAIKQLQRVILVVTKGKHMKLSDISIIHAHNAIIMQLKKENFIQTGSTQHATKK